MYNPLFGAIRLWEPAGESPAAGAPTAARPAASPAAPAAQPAPAKASPTSHHNVSSLAARLKATLPDTQQTETPAGTEPAAGADPDSPSSETTPNETPAETPAEGETANAEAAPEGEKPAGEEGTETTPAEEPARVRFTPEQQKVFDREVGKVRGEKIKAVEAEKLARTEADQHKATAEATRRELEAVRGERVVPAPTPQNPFSDITTPAKLEELADEAMRFQEWATLHPDGGPCPLFTQDGKPQELNAEQTRGHLAKVNAMLQRGIPQRRNYLAAESTWNARAVQAFPALKNAASELSVAVNSIYATIPEIKRLPNHRVAAMQAVLGGEVMRLGGDPLTHLAKLREIAGAAAKATTPAKAPIRAIKPRPALTPAAKSSVVEQARTKGRASTADLTRAIAATLR